MRINIGGSCAQVQTARDIILEFTPQVKLKKYNRKIICSGSVTCEPEFERAVVCSVSYDVTSSCSDSSRATGAGNTHPFIVCYRRGETIAKRNIANEIAVNINKRGVRNRYRNTFHLPFSGHFVSITFGQGAAYIISFNGVISPETAGNIYTGGKNFGGLVKAISLHDGTIEITILIDAIPQIVDTVADKGIFDRSSCVGIVGNDTGAGCHTAIIGDFAITYVIARSNTAAQSHSDFGRIDNGV
jgi:hypothetical protein